MNRAARLLSMLPLFDIEALPSACATVGDEGSQLEIPRRQPKRQWQRLSWVYSYEAAGWDGAVELMLSLKASSGALTSMRPRISRCSAEQNQVQ